MPTNATPAASTVLITGASGFIAQHTILQLLELGYRVRGSIRSLPKGDAVRSILAEHSQAADHFELVEGDLTSDDGWREAARGCRFVLHMASPMPAQPPKDENDLIVPARDGTLRVLAAATDEGVERVVLTSSIAAVLYGHARDGSRVYDESDWSQLTDEVSAYTKSKTIAERAAWEYIEGLPESKRPEFCAVNPGLVLGPVLSADFSTSGELVRKLMQRNVPGCPDLGWAMVDVRDVAAAHLAAMTIPAANGRRFIVAGEHASVLDIAKILARAFGARGYRPPTRRLPGWIFQLVARWDRSAALAVRELGKRQDVSSQRAKDVLGWQPRSLEDMVVAMGESMIRYGVV